MREHVVMCMCVRHTRSEVHIQLPIAAIANKNAHPNPHGLASERKGCLEEDRTLNIPELLQGLILQSGRLAEVQRVLREAPLGKLG